MNIGLGPAVKKNPSVVFCLYLKTPKFCCELAIFNTSLLLCSHPTAVVREYLVVKKLFGSPCILLVKTYMALSLLNNHSRDAGCYGPWSENPDTSCL